MTENDRLAQLYPWLATVARRMNVNLADDLKQVGAVAAWKALASFDGKSQSPEPWMKKKAMFEMQSFLQRVSGTKAGSKKPGWDIPVEEEDLDATVVEKYNELCYHYSEIHGAVAALPSKQQEYIRLRFWEGKGHSEIEKHFGYNPTGLWYSSAKKTLRERLAHLEGVV